MAANAKSQVDTAVGELDLDQKTYQVVLETSAGDIRLDLLPDVAREVGKDVEIVLDTGIMNGADIVASIALGADFTLVGRAYLYGLMAGGKEGVDRAIEILSEQIERTMKLLQVRSVDELSPKHVTQLQRLIPRQ